MKAFYYKNSSGSLREAGKTFTVSELRAELSKYPDDMPVLASWEDVYAFIYPKATRVETVPVVSACQDSCQQCLILDVNEEYAH